MSLQEQGMRAPPTLLPLLNALGHLKRIRSAGRVGSIAERLFAAAWSRLVDGEQEAEVANGIVADALVATRLGDIDTQVLAAVGIPYAESLQIRRGATEVACGSIDGLLRTRLLDASTTRLTDTAPPSFVARLAAQPRAGATHPDHGRLLLEPPENHAEHCMLVAVYGTLLAPAWDANPNDVFLAGLAHHLHNALLPDSGYAGEMLLGRWLQPAIANATNLALQELPSTLRARVTTAMQIVPDADSPEGRAFHAADTLDRVLQMDHHLRAANTTLQYGLRHMELVHPGPVKPFQDAVLVRMGLAA